MCCYKTKFYQFQSNYIHAHVIVKSKEGKLSDTIRDFKKHTSGQILELISTNSKESRKEWLEMIFKYHARSNKRTGARQLWTHEDHAVELGTNEMINSRLDYILNNPVRAGWVENPEDYLYSSAKKNSGL